MEFKDFEEVFNDVMPIIYKAAPLIGALIGGPMTNVIIGLLAALAKTNPCDHQGTAQCLRDDVDLYAKLQSLESTHSGWLNLLNSR